MRERGLNGMQLTVYSKGGQGDRRYPQLRLLCTKEEATGKGNEGNTKSRGEGKRGIWQNVTSYPPNAHPSLS